MLKAFDTLAGSSYGTWTQREIAVELLGILERYHPTICPELYVELAPFHDEQTQEINDLINDLIDHLNYYAERDPFTSIEWHDNEIVVMPYLDDDINKVSDIPVQYQDDYLYLVNDHGNVDCLEWSPAKKRYSIVWSMV